MSDTNDDDGDDIDYGTEILTTKSVTSCVFREGDQVTRADVHEGEEQPHGHIFLSDWDETTQRKARKWAAELDGITALFESSEGSYHAWNLCVAPLPEQTCRLVVHRDDESHVRAGIKRGYWRLRHEPKQWNYEDEQYKDAPEFDCIMWNTTAIPQSRPHFDLLQSMVEIPDELSDHLLKFEWVGDSTSQEEYETLTDEGKDDLAADGDPDHEKMQQKIGEASGDDNP